VVGGGQAGGVAAGVRPGGPGSSSPTSFSSKVQPVRGYRGGCSGSWVRELEERQWVRGEGAARGGAGLKVEEQRGPALGRR
jgi:hypothetical protein